MRLKKKNIELEMMLTDLQSILPHRDKAGYVAARNTRIIKDTLTEYLDFKVDLIRKYGKADKDSEGNDLDTISIYPDSPEFEAFSKEFDEIKNIEHEVDIMTMNYDEVIGILNGEEILMFDWMFTEQEVS